LLVELKKIEEAGYGSAEVWVEADHGQQPTNSHSVTIENYSVDDDHCIHQDDIAAYENFELEKIILISD
jgi:hypothetical protein